MYDFLDAKRFKEADNCEVFVETLKQAPNRSESGAATSRHGLTAAAWVAAVVAATAHFFWG